MFDYNTENGQIRMYGEVGHDFTDESFMTVLDEMGGRDISIKLQSNGGDVIAAKSIYNAITSYPGNVEVVADSMIASAATFFPLAADRITAYENTTVMVHRAWVMAMGNKNDMMITADILDMLDGDIAAMYAKKSGKSKEFWLAKMDAETYLTAAEAMELGLIDGLVEPESSGTKNVCSRQVVSKVGDYAIAAKMIEDVTGVHIDAKPRAASLSVVLANQKLKIKSLI